MDFFWRGADSKAFKAIGKFSLIERSASHSHGHPDIVKPAKRSTSARFFSVGMKPARAAARRGRSHSQRVTSDIVDSINQLRDAVNGDETPALPPSFSHATSAPQPSRIIAGYPQTPLRNPKQPLVKRAPTLSELTRSARGGAARQAARRHHRGPRDGRRSASSSTSGCACWTRTRAGRRHGGRDVAGHGAGATCTRRRRHAPPDPLLWRRAPGDRRERACSSWHGETAPIRCRRATAGGARARVTPVKFGIVHALALQPGRCAGAHLPGRPCR